MAEMTAVDGRDTAAQALPNHAPADVRHALRGEPELLEDRARRRRGAEMVEADDRTLIAHPTLPAERHADLDADALADGRRQHGVAVRLILEVELLPTGERHDPRADVVA